MDRSTQDDWLHLSLVSGLGPTLVRRSVDALGSPRAVLAATVEQLAAVRGIGKDGAMKIRSQIDRLDDGLEVKRERHLIEEHQVRLYTMDDPGYPALLRHIPDPPPLLYVRGELRDDDAVALGIVGARRCTQYGREQANRLAMLTSQAGLCIVSGGAYGVDAAAHRAALQAGGRTIAVVGSGLTNPYPPPHAELFDQITAGSGAVISEFPMAFPPLAENFPRRNRIISGLALGILVIEAAARSGALITARLCVEEHGREVMALPGRVDSSMSAGCHKMIREGWATLVTSASDILDALGETGQLLRAGFSQRPQGDENLESIAAHRLTDSQRRVVDALGEPHGFDQLAASTGLSVHVLQSDLTLLELRGLVEKSGGRFNRKRARTS